MARLDLVQCDRCGKQAPVPPSGASVGFITMIVQRFIDSTVEQHFCGLDCLQQHVARRIVERDETQVRYDAQRAGETVQPLFSPTDG